MVGPLAILSLVAVPIRWPHLLAGYRFGVWCVVSLIVTALALRPLVPDLDAARPLLATVAVGFGLPSCGLLTVALAERWSWRRTVPLALVAAVCGLLHTLTPAYAADPVAVAPVVTAADPMAALLLALASGQVPSGVTLLIVAGLMLRKLHELIDKLEKVEWKFKVSLDPETAFKTVYHYPSEVHHHGAADLPPDPPSEERSGARPRPPRR
jgi:hypothetical protein